MTDPPPPVRIDATPRALFEELAAHVGETRAAETCARFLRGVDPTRHQDVLPYFAGRATDAVLAGSSPWQPYWLRVWGARGLLYVWSDAVAGDVLAGLRDEHWRVAEMCLKVSGRRDLPVAEDGVRLSRHELPRVRSAALRALGITGDTEHVDAVVAAVEDPAEEVRRAAARALERLESRLDLPGPH